MLVLPVVFSSSCTVYGDAVCPFDENTLTGHVASDFWIDA